ncbi:MAG: hypothetical protein GY786_19370, partial [Proteobacteria bacterium]|nr:hypothetical protein [Pseudomonadota bacterium]
MCAIAIRNCKHIRHGRSALAAIDKHIFETLLSPEEIKVYAMNNELLIQFVVHIYREYKPSIDEPIQPISRDNMIHPIEPDEHAQYIWVSPKEKPKLCHYKQHWIFNRDLFHHYMCKFEILLSLV